MSIERTKSKQKVKEPKTKITWKEIKRQKVLLFWAAIMVVYGVVFYYLPLAGWTMAFQNYKPRLGIFHSQFVGWDKFRTLFSDMTFIRVIRNTLAMGVINLVVTFITAIVFAILLNEITSIDPSLYEAAAIDGAGRWAKIKHVTLPGIKPTIIILLLMNVGNVLNAGFEVQYLLGNGLVQKVSQTIDIYVLKWGISQGDFAIGTAAGIFKSFVSIILIVIANQIAKRNGEEQLF